MAQSINKIILTSSNLSLSSPKTSTQWHVISLFYIFGIKYMVFNACPEPVRAFSFSVVTFQFC